MNDLAQSYDNVLYKGAPLPQTHPTLLATIADMQGMSPARPELCRVLELGCGFGRNLIPMAEHYPQSQFVGIDLSSKAIADGKATIEALGRTNIELRQFSIMDVDESFGTFDYIIAHGVYSWVPDPVRIKMMHIFRERLAPQGVAYVSFNCLPGCYLRNIARDVMKFHTRRLTSADERLAQARAIIKFVADATDEKEFYGFIMRDQNNRVEKMPDFLLFHDDLSENAEPFLVHQVIDRANANGLQYLGDSSNTRRLYGHLARVNPMLDQFGADNITEREQYADFLTGRAFRETLLCHGDIKLDRRYDHNVVKRYHVASLVRPDGAKDPEQPRIISYRFEDGGEIRIDHALSQAALTILGERWPSAVPFGELAADAWRAIGGAPADDTDRLDHEDALCRVLHAAHNAARLELHLSPPPVVITLTERPHVSDLARMQASAGEMLTSRRHGSVVLEGAIVRHFVTLLDGTRDREALRRDLQAFVDQQAAATAQPANGAGAAAVDTILPEHVQRNLEIVSHLGLLKG
jgi:methyltransferase-like protein/2-polyprenyl-3-methyl-5-hydroxy-6-metoxy-1,4-benzoquinol methylase